MKKQFLDNLVYRALDEKLTFKTIYYLIVGDYPPSDGKSILVLNDFYTNGQMSTSTYASLVKLCPTELLA